MRLDGVIAVWLTTTTWQTRTSTHGSKLSAMAVFAIALTLLIIDIKIPASEGIGTTRELWLALGHLGPSIFAFVLSFAVILITWVNHHRFFRLVNKSSGSFVYANGFLLLLDSGLWGRTEKSIGQR